VLKRVQDRTTSRAPRTVHPAYVPPPPLRLGQACILPYSPKLHDRQKPTFFVLLLISRTATIVVKSLTFIALRIHVTPVLGDRRHFEFTLEVCDAFEPVGIRCTLRYETFGCSVWLLGIPTGLT